jgi:sec-independent protein translocase protein TatB
MFDIGWQELFLIGVVALVVVGPKDLPRALRTLGMAARKARAMAGEFQSGVAEMMREAELEELRRTMDKARRFDFEDELKDVIDPTGSLSEDFDPAEFTRDLKARVEAGPPQGPASPSPPGSTGQSASAQISTPPLPSQQAPASAPPAPGTPSADAPVPETSIPGTPRQA